MFPQLPVHFDDLQSGLLSLMKESREVCLESLELLPLNAKGGKVKLFLLEVEEWSVSPKGYCKIEKKVALQSELAV